MPYVPGDLFMVTNAIGGIVPRHFVYRDVAAESDATLVGAGFFSDGKLKGMRVGDIVDVIQPTGPKYKRYQVASLTGDAATVAAPTAIT